MPIQELEGWLDEHVQPDVLVFAKRLAANDTLSTGSHQYGTLIPKQVAYGFAPSMNRPTESVTVYRFRLMIDSHLSDLSVRRARLIRYNSKIEARITGYGGSRSPLLDPESTGALAVFAFHRETQASPPNCHVWVCEHGTEADLVEERIGPVEPKRGRTWPDLFAELGQPAKCWLEPEDIPRTWLERFPTGEEMIQKTVELRPERSVDVDGRLIHRRDCEYELFRSVEHAVEWPRVLAGYESMEAFLGHAQSVIQRRRSRSGNSLELHVRQIFREERLVEGRDFEYKPESEPGKEPDFLFPNAEAYHDPGFPDRKLRMLGAKTTLRDRWSQVLEEADRVETKHLLTLQNGVSEKQFNEMQQRGIQLVVPRSLQRRYPTSVQPQLQTLESFLADIRLLAS